MLGILALISAASHGTPIFRSVFAKTQKMLMEKLHQHIETYRDVELSEDCDIPLGEWLDRWKENYAAYAVRPNTLSSYESMIENYIKPRLGMMRISDITTEDIQQMYNGLKENGRINEHETMGYQLADSSIRRIHMMLHEAMDAAVREHLVVDNPTNGTRIPKPNYPPKQILTEEQVERFMTELENDAVWHDFFYTELTTGLRRGEICGLQWQDLDFSTGKLRIRRAVIAMKHQPCCVGETKTDAGRRTISAAVLRLESGVMGTYMMNAETTLLDMADFRIYGTKGTLLLANPNNFGGEVTFVPNERARENKYIKLESVSDLQEELRGIGPAEMADAISEGHPSHTDASIGIHVLDIVSTIMKSSRSGKKETVESTCAPSKEVFTGGGFVEKVQGLDVHLF